MRTLLRFFSWRYLRRHPIRVYLSAMSIALGVALFASGDVSNTSTQVAFSRTVKRLSGNAKLQVVRGRTVGVDVDVLPKIDQVEGIKAAPVIQLSTTVPGTPAVSLMIMGLDFNRDASFRLWKVAEGEKPQINPLAFLAGDVILVSKAFAQRRNLKLGGAFRIDTPLGPRPVTIGAIFKDEGAAQVFGGNIAVMPLKTLQRLFRREGTVDRVEILVPGDVDAAAKRLREAIGPDYLVRPPPSQNSFLDEAMTRLQALQGISIVALLVGLFIIYNSVSISVVERVREIGTLRATGATRNQICGVILLEWVLIGLIGSTGGLLIGIGLAQALIEMTAKEVNQVTMVVDVSGIAVRLRTILGSIGLGTLTTVAAAYFPARAAMSITPVEMLREGVFKMHAAGRYRAAFVAGLVSIAASIGALAGPFRFENVGLVASFFAFLGAALIMPQVAFWTTHGARPILRRLFNLSGFLAADNLGKYPQRTALTVIALAGSLAMMVASSSIIIGIRERSREWMADALPFDCTVNAVDYSSTIYANVTVPEGVPAAVEAVEGVDYLYSVRSAFQDYGDRDVMIFAVEMDRYARMQAERGRTGFLRPGTLPELLSGKGVIVSENFAALHGVRKGDTIEFITPRGPRRFEVLSTYEEYSWPQGSIYIHRAVYQEQWEDPTVSYVDVKFKPGVSHEEVRKRIQERVKDIRSLFVYDVEELKQVSDKTINDTLVLTNVQVAVAIIIGFLGIVNTLLISVLRRTREIGLLRAVGMTRGQVAEMILIESLFVAGIGAVLGIALGLMGAKWPLALHVAQISGYWMPLYIPWMTLLLAVGASIAIGVLASILPAQRASKLNLLEALKYE